MSNSMAMALDSALIIAFIVVTVVLWQERAHDEREKMHRMMADRIGFLVGAGALAVAMVVQSLRDEPSSTISGILFLMILAKIAGHLWSKRNS